MSGTILFWTLQLALTKRDRVSCTEFSGLPTGLPVNLLVGMRYMSCAPELAATVPDGFRDPFASTPMCRIFGSGLRYALVIAGAALPLMPLPIQAEYTTFLDNGPSSNRVDIVFLGDGYTSTELLTCQMHIDAMMNHMFNQGEDPFPRYRNYFNAHRIDLLSEQSGADDPTEMHFVDTALDATYRYDGSTQRLLYINEVKANAEISAGIDGAFTVDMRIVTVNASQYGGGGGNYSVYAGGSTAATEIALHELGHSFAGLADEYGGFTVPYTGAEPVEPNVTKDPTGAEWSRWIGYEQAGIGVIGAYQGARYYNSGLYRPSLDSKMRTLGRPFDAVSREEIILDIYRIVDPLDAWLSNSEPLNNPITLWVDSIDPAIIQHQWFVDGSLIPGATGEEFDPLAFGFGPGTYSITAHNFDPADWVRSNFDLLQQDITWVVQYTIPEPSSVWLLANAVWFFGWRRMRRERAVGARIAGE